MNVSKQTTIKTLVLHGTIEMTNCIAVLKYGGQFSSINLTRFSDIYEFKIEQIICWCMQTIDRFSIYLNEMNRFPIYQVDLIVYAYSYFIFKTRYCSPLNIHKIIRPTKYINWKKLELNFKVTMKVK